MGFKDPHDERQFRRFAQCAADGTVLAMIEVADSAPDPISTPTELHVDVSALGLVDLAAPAAKAAIISHLPAVKAKAAHAG